MARHLGTFQRGETIRFKTWVWNEDGDLANPTTHFKITVKDPQEVSQVDAQPMDNDDTGLDHYDYTSADTVSSGDWTGYVEAKSGTVVTKKPFTFILEVV